MAEKIKMNKRTGEDIVQTASQLDSEVSNWKPRWQEAMDYLMPRKSDIIRTTTGPKTVTQIFDTTGAEACQNFAAGMFGHLCPSSSRFIQIEPSSSDLKQPPNMRWCEIASEAINFTLADSNFGQEITETFLNHGALGTDTLYIEPKDFLSKQIVVQNIPINEARILENYQGLIDSHYRTFKLIPRQAVQWFGKENLSDDLNKAFETPARRFEKFEFIHCVEPREEYDKTKIDTGNRPFASYIVEKKTKQIIKESGYYENPFISSRFLKTQGEIPGWSPGIQLLPEIKTVNAWYRILLAAGEKVVDPPLQLPNDGFIMPIITQPGGINYYMPQAKDNRIEPIETKGNLPVGFQFLQIMQDKIRKGFFNDLFIILSQDGKTPKTATEIMERGEERVLLLVFYLGRLEYELFQQLALRVLGILLRCKAIPKPPADLEKNGGIKVCLTSKLAQRIRKAEVAGFQDVLQMNLEIAKYTSSQEPFDWFNFDVINPDLIGRAGCPASWASTIEDVKKKRAERTQAAKAEQRNQMLSMMAQNANKLNTKIQPGSPTDIISNQMGKVVPQGQNYDVTNPQQGMPPGALPQ